MSMLKRCAANSGVSAPVSTATTARRPMSLKVTPALLQVQRPDIHFESHGAGFHDPATANTSGSMFSKYKPSAPPADLQHTAVDVGLGANAADPYVRTLPNIPTTAPPMGSSGVSYGQTGPATTVLSSIAVAAGAAGSGMQASAATNELRRATLSVEEIASLEKGAYTMTEWIGMATKSAAVDLKTAASPNTTSTNNGLLKIYIENFLKIDVPIPTSPQRVAKMAAFEATALPELCMAAGRADTAVVVEQWKQLIGKLLSTEKLLLSPEPFLEKLEAAQRECLQFVIRLNDAAASGSGGADASSAANQSTSTEGLLSAAPEEAVQVVKSAISMAIEARNAAIDTDLIAAVANTNSSAYFDEGNAVWRGLLQAIDAQKYRIFTTTDAASNNNNNEADHSLPPADANSTTSVPIEDSAQLAMFEWVMSHDRPLPKVTAPVALLFVLAAVRAVAPTAATTASATTFVNKNKNAASPSASNNHHLLDAASRASVPRLITIADLALVSDDNKAAFLHAELEKLFSATASTAATTDGKAFIQQLRAAGFDVDVLELVELQLTKARQLRDVEGSRFKTVIGSNDVGALTAPTTTAGGAEVDGAKDAASKEKKPTTNTTATVSNPLLSKVTKEHIAPIVSLFQNGKGASSLFQHIYKSLASTGGAAPRTTTAPLHDNDKNMLAPSTESLLYVSRALGMGTKADNISTVFNSNSPKFAEFWAANYKTYAELLLTDGRLLEMCAQAVRQLLIGNAQLSEGIISKEGLKMLDMRRESLAREGAEDRNRFDELKKVLTARQNVTRVIECAALAGADVTGVFRAQELAEAALKGTGPTNNATNAAVAAAALAANVDIARQVGAAVSARHPNWAAGGVIPSDAAAFVPDVLLPIAAHVFVRLSFIPHTALALMKRNYRGRIGEVFVPNASSASTTTDAPTPQPRHQNVPVELGKVEHYDAHLYKRNDPQGWYQRMQDVHNRNVSVKVDMRDLRTVSDDFSLVREKEISLGGGGGGGSSSSSSSTPGSSSTKDASSSAADEGAGKQVYFGTQQERRLRVLAGDRVGMGIVKLDSDRYEDQSDNESYGVMKLQQLLSDAKKTELGKAYWPSVEVKVRQPSGQSRTMQSLIDYNRIETQSKDLYAQYREIKKKALFVSPTDLYLKDRSESQEVNSSAKTSVTSEGYVVGSE